MRKCHKNFYGLQRNSHLLGIGLQNRVIGVVGEANEYVTTLITTLTGHEALCFFTCHTESSYLQELNLFVDASFGLNHVFQNIIKNKHTFSSLVNSDAKYEAIVCI